MKNIDTNIYFFGNGLCKDFQNKEHKSSTYNTVYAVYGGRCEYNDGIKNINFQKNYVYILPANKDYVMKRYPEDSLNHIWFHTDIFPIINCNTIIEFDMKTSKYVQSLVEAAIFRISDLYKYLTSGFIDRYILNEKRIIGLPPRKMNNGTSNMESYTAIFNSLNTILQCILSYILLENDNKYILLHDRYIGMAYEFIRDHYHENIDNQIIAERINIARPHLYRIFKQKMNITPHQYLLNYRLSMANFYLSQGLPVTRVAEQVGLDPKTFSRIYKAKHGFPPSRYSHLPYP